MAFLSTSRRAALILSLLAGTSHAAPAASSVPGALVVARPAAIPAAKAAPATQEAPTPPAAAPAPQLTLQLGPFELRYAAHLDRPTLLDRLLFGSRVSALARQVASGHGPRLPF